MIASRWPYVRQLLMACAVVVSVTSLAGVMATSPVAAAFGAPPFRPSTIKLAPGCGVQGLQPECPHLAAVAAPQAIALLNQQRTANGIPGDLVEEPHLSAGCLSWATAYRPAKGQYPHEELPSQPGYTAAGNEAAGSSDLGEGELWGPLFNPWSGAALHEASLMDPAVTTAWYGEGRNGECMGTSGARPFTTAAFYSVPGPDATNVPIAEGTGELPFSPQQAVGLGNDPGLAPVIPLWAEDTPRAKLQTATLATAQGTRVPISLVTPESPTPRSPAGWPSVASFGGYTSASFVVPRVKFKANMSYLLTATWQTPSGAAIQTVPFKTAATDLNNLVEAFAREQIEKQLIQLTGIQPGLLTPSLSGRTLTIQATGLAIGRYVKIVMYTCGARTAGERNIPPGSCVYRGVSSLNRTVRLATTPVRLIIPRPPRGKRSQLELSMAPFKVKGEHIYPGSTSVIIGR